MTSLMAIVLTLSFGAHANDTNSKQVTFYEDVLPVIQENCQVCHRANGQDLGGMVAPMAFTTYEETRPWAKAMARKTATGEMPPWHASENQSGVFVNERSMTQDEIDVFARWAATGAKRGNPNEAPSPIQWPANEGWSIGEPDLVINMPKRHFVDDDVTDEYKYFTHKLSSDIMPEDRWLKAVEFRAGSKVVHHIILDPLGGIAPGSDPIVYDEGTSRLMEAGSHLTWQMHYHKEPGPGSGMWDQSSVAIKFYPEDVKIENPVHGSYLGNMSFKIPAGDPNYSAESVHTFRNDARIINFAPHMHLRGKSAIYEATYPDGTTEILLEVPKYDFNWQTTYKYSEPKYVPKGTKITFTSTWDNSAQNPHNPDPTLNVRYGEPTTDEMSFGFMDYIDTAQSDD